MLKKGRRFDAQYLSVSKLNQTKNSGTKNKTSPVVATERKKISKTSKDHPAFAVLRKFQQGNFPKEYFGIKSVIRIINSQYLGRAVEFRESASLDIPVEEAITLLEWMYDYMLYRYGLVHVAERKFVALLYTCSGPLT